MRKVILCLVVIVVIPFYLFAQANKDILAVNYTLTPISQHYIKTTPNELKDIIIPLRSGYEYKFTLLFDFKSRKSVFTFDTLVVTKVKGKEGFWTDAESKIMFCLTNSDGSYHKKEKVLSQEVYVKGSRNSVEWDILDETKDILGFKCYKAVSKDKSYFYTAWFTKEIPIQAGPSSFNNLPGLVLWAEDFFNTISVTKISYENNSNELERREKLINNELNSIKKDDFSDEKVFFLYKSKLINLVKSER